MAVVHAAGRYLCEYVQFEMKAICSDCDTPYEKKL